MPAVPGRGPHDLGEPLGDYYGWKLWIGGARERRATTRTACCSTATAPMRADCVSTALQREGALLVSVPYAEIAPAERPDGMTPDQSLGFWWGTDGVDDDPARSDAG